MDLDDVTIEDKEYRKQLMAEKEALEGLKLDSNVKFEVVSIADIDYTGTGTVNADTPLKIKFNLNDRNVKAGDKIHVLHEVDGSWVVFDAVVKSDADSTNPMLYIEYDMTDFSPVAIIKYTNSTDDDPTVLPPNNDPTDDPTNDPTVTPGTNGNITADQLVDLIVNRLFCLWWMLFYYIILKVVSFWAISIFLHSFGQGYFWCVDQCEFATDVMFKERYFLEDISPLWLVTYFMISLAPMSLPLWDANRTRGFRERLSPTIKNVPLPAG